MIRLKVLSLFAFLCAVSIAACSTGSGSGSSTPLPGTGAPGTAGASPTPGTPTYTQISQNILQPNCVRCHSGSSPSGGIDLSTYAGVSTQVVPGNPGNSNLYQVVASGQMPPGGPTVPQSDAQQISDWISAGALNN